MRRALFPLLLLVLGLPGTVRAEAADGKASGEIDGNRLIVSWQQSPSDAREWEAFLSLDGGRSYPLRVTPHLSIDIRSFSWPIPRVLAGAARLRIRFGNGRREREFDVDGTWAIAPDRESRLLLPEIRDFAESPAPGEEQAAAWTEWNGERPRMVMPSSPPGARSTSDLRPASAANSALPARRLFEAPPSPNRERESPSRARWVLRETLLSAPSLARFSRLNV